MNLYFQLLPHNVHGEDVVVFLRELKASLGGPLTVLWNRSPVHRKSAVVHEFLAHHPEIMDELVWSWSKYGRLANLVANDTDHLAETVIDELMYLKEHPELLASFVRKTELPLAV